MGSRKRISYQWQLFVPLVIALWAVIIGMSFWHYSSARRDRIDMLHTQLDLINQRIVMAYDNNYDPGAFIDFVWQYYRDKREYDLVRVSVYKDGKLIRSCGEPILIDNTETPPISDGIGHKSDLPEAVSHDTDIGLSEQLNPMDYFYFQTTDSSDGRMKVLTLLPFDRDIIAASTPDKSIVYIMVFLGLVMTILAYYSTRYFGKNISMLKRFAERASNEPDFVPSTNYPHDELGDISREIVNIYNQRTKAITRMKKEHEVALHAIEEKARSKRLLTNNINHELRTPIGVIKGYLDTIVENPDMNEESRKRFIAKALEHVNRLVNLIADVSAITRLEEGGDLINTEPINFHDLVYTLANDFEASGSLGSMSFDFDIPLGIEVMGNYNLLTGAIINLAKNAVSYSKGTICELCLTGEDEKFYTFEFRDDGVGVGEEHIPHLFERFYRVDSGRSRKAGGTGLGLPILHNTIIAHGGKISVANRQTGGLVFTFTLPKVKSAEKQA